MVKGRKALAASACGSDRRFALAGAEEIRRALRQIMADAGQPLR